MKKEELIRQINALDIERGEKSLDNLKTYSEKFKQIIRDNFKIEEIV